MSASLSTPSPNQPAELQHPLTRLDALLVGLMLVWGMNFVVAKAAMDILPPLVFNAIRFSLAALTLGAVFRLSGVKLTLPRKEWLGLIGVAFLGNGLFQPFFMNGLHRTSVANSVLITTTGPVWITLFNAVRGNEQIRRVHIAGLLLSVSGVAIVIVSRYAGQLAISSTTLLGDGLTIFATLIWVTATLFSRGPLGRNPTLQASFWIVFFAAVFQTILAIPDLAGFDWSAFKPNMLLAVVYSGCLSIGVGNLIWNRGIKQLGTSRTAVYTYFEPVVAASAGVMLLGEALTIWLIIGTVLTLLGVWLVKRG